LFGARLKIKERFSRSEEYVLEWASNVPGPECAFIIENARLEGNKIIDARHSKWL
jgi:hypothetical protein